MFLTLTCPGYGRVSEDGTPIDSAGYDYIRAARDALHFAALFDRFTQNLRRVLGYDVQYFATIEPQRRLAPHVHIAMRGTISRAELREIIAATYHQVWWPATDQVRFEGRLTCRSGTNPAAAISTPPPASCCPPGTRPWTPSAMTISRGTWSVSGPSSTPRVCRRIQRLSPLYRLPDQVPDQAARRSATSPAATPSASTWNGSPRAAVRAVLPDMPRTGCATASSPRTPGPAWFPALQGQGPPLRPPRLRRAPGAGLP